jgi:hypothetical protein
MLQLFQLFYYQCYPALAQKKMKAALDPLHGKVQSVK